MNAAAFLDGLVAEAEGVVANLPGNDSGDWREVPVGLVEFVRAPEHLNLGPLFPLQEQSMERLLGTDPQLMFEEPGTHPLAREFQIAVLLWGKGSGKDYLCSIVVCYLVYVLLCLRDPQDYFEFGRGEPIDVVNVAYNADQAKRVFFAKLKARMSQWRWLNESFNVHEAGRRRGPHKLGRPDVHINDNEVLFPRDIRCFSRHAQNESYEGLNVIAWVMDEASAFLSKAQRENANAIYQTLRTSAASRFQRRWVGFIISYPRHGDDFTMTMLKRAQADPSMGVYADGPRATWEVNERLGRGEFVEVREGHRVPVELANDYTLDFEEALSRYECRPPMARDAFFKFPDRIQDAIATGRAPLIEWEPGVTYREVSGPDGEPRRRAFRTVKLTNLRQLPKGVKLYGHGDPGLVNDSFALALGHGVPATVMLKVPAREVLTLAQCEDRRIDPDALIDWEREVTRTVIDAVIVWKPDPRQDMEVDLQNVEDVIFQLKKAYPSLGHKAKTPTLTFDHWNSALTVQRMVARKMNVEDEAWTRGFQVDIFRNARTNFYNDLVTLPDTPSVTSVDPSSPGALYELQRIEFIDGSKVDHPEGGSKDIADAVVRVIQHVTAASKSGFSFAHAHGHTSAYDAGFANVRDDVTEVRPINPAKPPVMATDRLKEQDAQARRERPLGELEPGEARVNGRKLSFGSVRRSG